MSGQTNLPGNKQKPLASNLTSVDANSKDSAAAPESPESSVPSQRINENWLWSLQPKIHHDSFVQRGFRHLGDDLGSALADGCERRAEPLGRADANTLLLACFLVLSDGFFQRADFVGLHANCLQDAGKGGKVPLGDVKFPNLLHISTNTTCDDAIPRLAPTQISRMDR